MLHPGKDNGRLFHDQTILYGCDPFDAPRDLTRFVDGLLRIDKAAQLHNAFVRFDLLFGTLKACSGLICVPQNHIKTAPAVPERARSGGSIRFRRWDKVPKTYYGARWAERR